MARVSTHLLEELVREAEVLSAIKADIPNSWKILEHEIGRARAAIVRAVDSPLADHTPSLALPPRQAIPNCSSMPVSAPPASVASSAALSSIMQSAPLGSPPPPQPRASPVAAPATSAPLVSSTSAAVTAAAAAAAAAIADGPAGSRLPPPRHSVRKRVKLRVPAEQYPDYNFVGRLLGPRGATLKRLERDTGCRIMIRGKGSIRKDKEAEVRGKPGWEHVFHEPLHVVIEVADATDDATASRTLTRAKELVEMLLVPVPEERDSLKRAQLRDLAILNGTHRSVSDLLGPALHPLSMAPARSPPPPSPPPLRRAMSQHAKPSSSSLYQSTDPYSAMLDPVAPFPRQPSTPTFPSSPAPPRSAAMAPPPMSNPSLSADSLLPDLEKLRLPTLEFDSLNEPNLSSPFPMPTPSPTIVDPEIYPYPPTPGLVSMDQQSLGAFASPMWNPRSTSNNHSASLPPRSPPAPSHSNPTPSPSAFLLGRAPTDNLPRGQPTHPLFTREGKNSTTSSANHRDLPSDHSFPNHLSSFSGEDELPSLSQFATGAPNASLTCIASPPPPRHATPSPPPLATSPPPPSNPRSPFLTGSGNHDSVPLSTLFPQVPTTPLSNNHGNDISLRLQPPASPILPLPEAAPHPDAANTQ